MRKLPPRPPSHHIWPFSAFQTCKVHDVQPPGKAIPKTAQSSSGPGNPKCNSRGSQLDTLKPGHPWSKEGQLLRQIEHPVHETDQMLLSCEGVVQTNLMLVIISGKPQCVN
ncbi:hypothetical protein T08_10253 [Trichinella sp. T8]|nr:hypothetical protein T08_10253 [Trichinella sp. T8]